MCGYGEGDTAIYMNIQAISLLPNVHDRGRLPINAHNQ